MGRPLDLQAQEKPAFKSLVDNGWNGAEVMAVSAGGVSVCPPAGGRNLAIFLIVSATAKSTTVQTLRGNKAERMTGKLTSLFDSSSSWSGFF